jgi:spore maturation protein CgeB
MIKFGVVHPMHSLAQALSSAAPDGCVIRKLAVVGFFDGTHVGGSFARGAMRLGINTRMFDVAKARGGNRWLRALWWRIADRRPLYLERFCANIVDECRKSPPQVLIATGAVLTRESLLGLRAMNIRCLNYSTDDPWNPQLSARWHLRALPAYDFVFTTRRSNIEDLRRLGCREVHYLPFAYDEGLFTLRAASSDAPVYDVVYVGTADRDRVEFMTRFLRSGLLTGLVGGYWERCRATRDHALGRMSPAELWRLTAAAKVNLCLIRRANRDGHVMRSFEIAAMGGCMLAEDTLEHREIFGEDGQCVVYFRTPEQAAHHARRLQANESERARLSSAIRKRITEGRNTYRDRLIQMLETATKTEDSKKVAQ